MKYIKTYENKTPKYIVTYFYDVKDKDLPKYYIFRVVELIGYTMKYSGYYYYDDDNLNNKLNYNDRKNNYKNFEPVFKILYSTNILKDAKNTLNLALISNKFNL